MPLKDFVDNVGKYIEWSGFAERFGTKGTYRGILTKIPKESRSIEGEVLKRYLDYHLLGEGNNVAVCPADAESSFSKNNTIIGGRIVAVAG